MNAFILISRNHYALLAFNYLCTKSLVFGYVYRTSVPSKPASGGAASSAVGKPAVCASYSLSSFFCRPRFLNVYRSLGNTEKERKQRRKRRKEKKRKERELCFALLCFALLCFALLCFALLCGISNPIFGPFKISLREGLKNSFKKLGISVSVSVSHSSSSSSSSSGRRVALESVRLPVDCFRKLDAGGGGRCFENLKSGTGISGHRFWFELGFMHAAKTASEAWLLLPRRVLSTPHKAAAGFQRAQAALERAHDMPTSFR